MLVCGFATVLLAAVMALLPVPYVVLSPGPVLNTLGSVDGKPLIAVSGRTTYPTTGELDLTTVVVNGGPQQHVSLLQVAQGWLDRTRSVVPQEEVYPPDQTAQQANELDQAEMVSSQESAKAAALRSLDIPVPTTLTVDGTDPGAPAAGILRKGDVILGVDGKETADLTSLRNLLQAITPGEAATVSIRRDGKQQDVAVKTRAAADGRTLLGVFIDPTFHFPFQVTIQIENIGGPSAGTMFALGIIDTLTPGDLTGGQDIAGTGTMDPDGVVGPIGGIQQKLVGARRAGARYFLAPADNCSEVVGHVPDGLSVVKVATLDEARHAVETIAAGKGTASLPSCSG
jgi:PDZ domain-containing protein